MYEQRPAARVDLGRRRRHVAPVLLVALTAMTGSCGGTATPEVARRMSGRRVVGYFVSPFSYEHFIRGELALARGDLQTAADELTLARAGPEEDPLVLARLADTLDRLDRREEADDVLREGLELFPTSEALWMARGGIEERRGRPEAAIAAYERAEAGAPTSAAPVLALSRVLREEGAVGRAAAVLSRFIDRSGPSEPETQRARLELALARDDADAAVESVQALLHVAPARAEDVLRAAQALYDDDRPVLAAQLLDAAPARLAPGLRIRALARAGRTDRAEALLATTPEEQIGGPLERARLYLLVDRPDRAQELADVTAVAEPGPEAWLVAGLARLAQNRYTAAAEQLVRVPRGVRGYAEARVALARALAAEGQAGVAQEVLVAALEGAVDDEAALRIALADLRVDSGDVDGGLDALRPLDDAGSMALRASLLERAGRLADARRAWRTVRVDTPALPPGVRARARAERLAATGRTEAAIGILTRRAAYARDDLWSQARLAELLAEAGRGDEARRVARQALAVAVEPALSERLRAVIEDGGN